MRLAKLRLAVASFKSRRPNSGESAVPVDPEELHLLDEFNFVWVKMWKRAVRPRGESEMPAIEAHAEKAVLSTDAMYRSHAERNP